MNHALLIIIMMVSLLGCGSAKKYSSLKIDDSKFQIRPTVMEVNGKYYLQYQFKNLDSSEIENKYVLTSNRSEGKGYFFMVDPVSFRQAYNVVQVEIKGKLLELLKKNDLYWLNPDGTEIKLQLQN